MARLLFFGKLGDLAGSRSKTIHFPKSVDTITRLLEFISAEDPELGSALADKSVRYIVNEQMETAAIAISADDEIAFLPPVSGG